MRYWLGIAQTAMHDGLRTTLGALKVYSSLSLCLLWWLLLRRFSGEGECLWLSSG